MKDEQFYGMSKIGEKGQIVIPAKARESLGIKTGDDFIFFGHQSMLHLIRAKELNSFLEKMTEKTNSLRKMIEDKETN